MERKISKIVLVPTEENTLILRNKYKFAPTHGNPFVFNDGSIDNHLERGYENQHIYVTTDDKILEGDLYLDKLTNEIYTAGERPVTMKCFVKIIGSSDKSLSTELKPCMIAPHGANIPLPLVKETFIRLYCESGGIDEVLVDYDVEEHNNPTGKWDSINVNSNNEITLHLIKENWSREEMLSAYRDGVSDGESRACGPLADGACEDEDKWVKENLL